MTTNKFVSYQDLCVQNRITEEVVSSPTRIWLDAQEEKSSHPDFHSYPSCQESSVQSQEGPEPKIEPLLQSETWPISSDLLVASWAELEAGRAEYEASWPALQRTRCNYSVEHLFPTPYCQAYDWGRIALGDQVTSMPLDSPFQRETGYIGTLTEYLASQQSSASSEPLVLKQKDQPRSKLQRLKRGISGYVNGKRIAAFPDTGSAQNIVSAAFVKERGLRIQKSEEAFKLGNSKTIKSTGIVDLVWAFAEDPAKAAKIVCHVLPTCQYDIILGHQFLTVSETMTKFRHRITECMFTMRNVLHVNLLGSSQEYIRGSLRETDSPLEIRALAALDTGAEGNIMSLGCALRQDFVIHKQPCNRKIIRYTDGSYDETVGMVRTRWTFESGLEIPVAFEVVENCIQDIVLGEEIVYGLDVYITQSESIAASCVEDASWRLATFSFTNKWQNWLRNMKLSRKGANESEGPEPRTLGNMKHEEWQERRRRDQWNYRYGFDGVKASEAERTAERQRRRLYDTAYGALPTHPPRLSSTVVS